MIRDEQRRQSARRYAASVMADRRALEGNGLQVFNTAMIRMADMTARHLSDGSEEWAQAYAEVWRYLHDSQDRLLARRVRRVSVRLGRVAS